MTHVVLICLDTRALAVAIVILSQQDELTRACCTLREVDRQSELTATRISPTETDATRLKTDMDSSRRGKIFYVNKWQSVEEQIYHIASGRKKHDTRRRR